MPPPPIVVVSGLPRSGTSLMMQMLAAGGMPVLTDRKRASDADNPRGYFEHEAAKRLKEDAGFLSDAGGKAVKLIHLLLTDLPDRHRYRVLFMRRDLTEVVASQRAMLARGRQTGSALPDDRLAEVFGKQLREVTAWLADRPNIEYLNVDYRAVVHDAKTTVGRINEFLCGGLDTEAMAAAVDPTLYRQRVTSNGSSA